MTYPKELSRRSRKFGDFTLIERTMAVGSGSAENWYSAVRDHLEVRLVGFSSAGVVLESVGDGLRLPRLFVPRDQMGASAVASAFHERGVQFVADLPSVEYSARAATLDSGVCFARGSIALMPGSSGEWASYDPAATFSALRTGRVLDDRDGRMLYEVLDLSLAGSRIITAPSLGCEQDSPRLGGLSPSERHGFFELIKGDGVAGSLVARPDGVRSIGTRDAGESVVLTREWRDELGGWDWRVPGGKVLKGAPVEAAVEEMRSETGYSFEGVPRCVHTSKDVEGVIYRLHYFIGSVVAEGAQRLHGAERIEAAEIGLDALFELLRGSGADRISEDRTARVMYELIPLDVGSSFRASAGPD